MPDGSLQLAPKKESLGRIRPSQKILDVVAEESSSDEEVGAGGHVCRGLTIEIPAEAVRLFPTVFLISKCFTCINNATLAEFVTTSSHSSSADVAMRARSTTRWGGWAMILADVLSSWASWLRSSTGKIISRTSSMSSLLSYSRIYAQEAKKPVVRRAQRKIKKICCWPRGTNCLCAIAGGACKSAGSTVGPQESGRPRGAASQAQQRAGLEGQRGVPPESEAGSARLVEGRHSQP
eukprot:scaffold24328_cov24-Prasinocladus_malaysianus.AAC.1